MSLPTGEAPRESNRAVCGNGRTSNTLTRVRAGVFQIPGQTFSDGDRLLICKHVFEDHYRGRLQSDGGGDFGRGDGSKGACSRSLHCLDCDLIPAKERDYHEWVYLNGWFCVADRMPDPSVPANAPAGSLSASPEAA